MLCLVEPITVAYIHLFPLCASVVSVSACVVATSSGVRGKDCLALQSSLVVGRVLGVMVWSCTRAPCMRELQFIEGNLNADIYCDILEHRMIPFLLKLG